MIYDTLGRLDLYRPLSPRLAAAIDWIGTTDVASLAVDGQRRSVVGDDVAIIVSRYTTWPAERYIWESHRKFIDIQIVLTGQEQISVTPVSDALHIATPYDDAKDVVFYARDTAAAATLHMTPGRFAVFFPEDAHGPNQAWGGTPAEASKLVVKVRV